MITKLFRIEEENLLVAEIQIGGNSFKKSAVFVFWKIDIFVFTKTIQVLRKILISVKKTHALRKYAGSRN